MSTYKRKNIYVQWVSEMIKHKKLGERERKKKTLKRTKQKNDKRVGNVPHPQFYEKTV